MRKDVGGAAAQVAESLGEVADEQVFQQFLGGRIKVGGVADFALYEKSQGSGGMGRGGEFRSRLTAMIWCTDCQFLCSDGHRKTCLFIQLHRISIFGKERGVTSLRVGVERTTTTTRRDC